MAEEKEGSNSSKSNLLITPVHHSALEDAQQKYGGKYFKDPKKNRAMNEKITDFLRKFFEKKTGYVFFFHLLSIFTETHTLTRVSTSSIKVPKSVSN